MHKTFRKRFMRMVEYNIHSQEEEFVDNEFSSFDELMEEFKAK